MWEWSCVYVFVLVFAFLWSGEPLDRESCATTDEGGASIVPPPPFQLIIQFQLGNMETMIFQQYWCAFILFNICFLQSSQNLEETVKAATERWLRLSLRYHNYREHYIRITWLTLGWRGGGEGLPWVPSVRSTGEHNFSKSFALQISCTNVREGCCFRLKI